MHVHVRSSRNAYVATRASRLKCTCTCVLTRKAGRRTLWSAGDSLGKATALTASTGRNGGLDANCARSERGGARIVSAGLRRLKPQHRQDGQDHAGLIHPRRCEPGATPRATPANQQDLAGFDHHSDEARAVGAYASADQVNATARLFGLAEDVVICHDAGLADSLRAQWGGKFGDAFAEGLIEADQGLVR